MFQPGEQLFSRLCIFYRDGIYWTVFRRLQNPLHRISLRINRFRLVSDWAPHCESEDKMGEKLELMADALIR